MDNINPAQFLFQSPSRKAWKKIGSRKRAGIVAPLFSLYSKKSVGIGEFADISLLVDWCVQTGHTIIQMLPVNDTGSTFCPYDSISSFALEPAYISLRMVDTKPSAQSTAKIDALKKMFPLDSTHVDYRIKNEKISFLWDIFQKSEESLSPGFAAFCKKNSYWLDDYAIFKVLKFLHGEQPWYRWPHEFSHRQQKALTRIATEHARAVLFQKWVQWHAHCQFRAAKEYAEKNSILIKGDLPVLVSRDSADVWSHPQYFKLDMAAGAPPDMYCAKGQRWGMPTYNWQAIAAGRYRYIHEKLLYAENFYDILRIDHVIGLFRMWSIPVAQPEEDAGLHGFYDPSDESKWRQHGAAILHQICESTSMLLCAEDLGVIPKACTDVLREMCIPGNDVQRWVKDWVGTHDFLEPEKYRVLSVAMLSTHDTTNWAAWWEYEAGTIDSVLFERMCRAHDIDYARVCPELFESPQPIHGRLRWKKSIASTDDVCWILQKPAQQLKDFIDLYHNTAGEKKLLWRHFRISGAVQEKASSKIVGAALALTLRSSAIFSIQLITDILMYAQKLTGDPYQYRINLPGTVNSRNWSLRMPISLESINALPHNASLAELIKKSDR